jgi:hypothetical protein
MLIINSKTGAGLSPLFQKTVTVIKKVCLSQFIYIILQSFSIRIVSDLVNDNCGKDIKERIFEQNKEKRK